MTDEELTAQIRSLRAAGGSPKQIARALGVPVGVVAPVVRAIAQQAAAAEPSIAGCWVSAGWSVGLTVEEGRAWPDRPSPETGTEGLVGVLVALPHDRDEGRVSVCGYLVDVYCLGVKDALGPRSMSRAGLRRFVDSFFAGFGAGLPAPIELARHLVWGAIDYARQLEFEPHRDFAPASGHLGEPGGPSAITFGRDGIPLYVQGPHDDVDAIIAKLNTSAGPGRFHFSLSLPMETPST